VTSTSEWRRMLLQHCSVMHRVMPLLHDCCIMIASCPRQRPPPSISIMGAVGQVWSEILVSQCGQPVLVLFISR